jgi:isocitrate dehydrogenase
MSKIIYTHTDEAPMLATYSFLPIMQTFCKPAEVKVEIRDISLSGRVLAHFPESFTHFDEATKKKVMLPYFGDHLAELGKWTQESEANIIKLPNISASIPQLNACIKELQEQGFKLPEFPMEPKNDEEKAIKAKYAIALGSAVNPVLREGNSDRRVADAVKQYAKKHPHKMGAWSKDCKSHVTSMQDGDYVASEKSLTMSKPDTVKIVFIKADDPSERKSCFSVLRGKKKEEKILKEGVKLQEGEVIDTAVMDTTKLRQFYQQSIDECKEQGVLLSLHLKATMMKTSDPIYFGHLVSVYYKEVLDKYAVEMQKIGFNPNLGIGELYKKLPKLEDPERQKEIEDAITAVYKTQPPLAMVDSDKGITNLHSPNDIIIDASMPVVVRDSGKMWTPDGAFGYEKSQLHDVKCCIPDRSYAGIYQECLDFCRVNGQFDVKTMGNVPNVGLMAQKAQEYGSHDKTFEMSGDGVVAVIDTAGKTLMEQTVKKGDVFRMCQVKDEPIRDWVKLAVSRAKATGAKTVFWLDKDRSHDAEIIAKVNKYLPEHDTNGLDMEILAPVKAIRVSMERAKAGDDTVGCTGNVLRDYLTDLFPILELGTSAKMLSIVPLLKGGGLYETGAGGSAPKHIQQLIDEGHLRWDSLGEFLALQVSMEELALKSNNAPGKVLAKALNTANCKFLDSNKGPGRKKGDLCTRGSHFYLCMYWAEALSLQDEDADLKAKFTEMYEELKSNEETIVAAFKSFYKQAPVDIGGYYHPDPVKTEAAMRPVPSFNAIIDKYNS